MVGENIAQSIETGWISRQRDYIENFRPTANLYVEMWIESEGHYRNMLSADWTHMGIGIDYRIIEGDIYNTGNELDARQIHSIWHATQMFGVPDSPPPPSTSEINANGWPSNPKIGDLFTRELNGRIITFRWDGTSWRSI